MNIDYSQLITAEAKAETTLTQARSTASLSRREFCLRLASMNILPGSDALASAKGEWPATMADFLGYLDADQALDAQIEWAAVSSIDRLHPMVLTLASWLDLPELQVDALFGIGAA